MRKKKKKNVVGRLSSIGAMFTRNSTSRVMPTSSLAYSTMAHDSAWESEWDNALDSLERGEYKLFDEESAYELLDTLRSGRGL
mmetsp:Transcript_14308/g.29220  ORF Transcript_14308/g.29220 Transcript_14308/m.29220 type:complete len:83 (+) Transcript_14308:706-954(+)